METFIFALAPVLVSLITSLAKSSIPLLATAGPTTLRVVVAALALLTAIVEASVSGVPVDAVPIEILTLTFVNALGATGVWHLWKVRTTPQ